MILLTKSNPASLRVVVVSFGCPPAVKSMSVSKKFFMKSHAQSVPIKKCSCKVAQDMVCLTKSKRGHCENHIFLTHFLGMLCSLWLLGASAPPPLSKQCLFQTGFMKSWSYTPNPSQLKVHVKIQYSRNNLSHQTQPGLCENRIFFATFLIL